jgi:hypothetical protein
MIPHCHTHKASMQWVGEGCDCLFSLPLQEKKRLKYMHACMHGMTWQGMEAYS